MRFPKFILVLSFITFLAVMYVYQQMKILHLAYEGQKRQQGLQVLVDRNNILRYNTAVCFSLPYLDKELLAKSADFEISQKQHLVRLNLGTKEKGFSRVVKKKINLFSGLFNALTKQAEAKSINR